ATAVSWAPAPAPTTTATGPRMRSWISSTASLAARLRHVLERSRLHLAFAQHAGDADPLAHVVLQLQPVRRVDHFDRGRAFLEEPRFPAARARDVGTRGVFQPVVVAAALEAT